MSRVKFVMGIFFLLVLGGIASSCTTTDDNFSVLNEEREATLNAETSKQQFANDLNKVLGNSTKTEGENKCRLSKEQVLYLQKSAVKMLNDEGVYSPDMDKLVEQNNAGIIFVGLMYLSLEKKSSNSSNLSSRSGSDNNDDKEVVCFSYEKLQKCIYSCAVSAAALDVLIGILNNYVEKGWAGCVTKAVIKKILVKVSNKLIGYGIGLAVEMVACVWDCMDFKF